MGYGKNDPLRSCPSSAVMAVCPPGFDWEVNPDLDIDQSMCAPVSQNSPAKRTSVSRIFRREVTPQKLRSHDR